jgi:ferredoxin
MTVRFKKKDQIFDAGECMRGLNLLGHAQLIELSVGSQCGGHGKCGKDLVELAENEQKKINPPTEIERKHLSEKQLARGLRLACQCFPNQDGLEIDVNG